MSIYSHNTETQVTCSEALKRKLSVLAADEC